MYVCGARQWCSQDIYVARAQVSADGAILRPEAPRDFFCKTRSPPVRCRYCCPHVLHHSPGSPRYTFTSVEPSQKEYVGYYRLTIESTVSSLAERRGKVT